MCDRSFKKVIIILVIIFLFISGCKPADKKWYGYNEGRFIYVSAQYPGVLTQLLVRKGDWVKKGDSLFELSKQPEYDQYNLYKAKLDSSKFNISNIEAALVFAKETLNRNLALDKTHNIQKAEVDSAISHFKQLTAQLESANADLNQTQAQLAEAEWKLQQKKFSAVRDAFIFDTYYLPGEFVDVGQTILSMLAPEEIKAIFYVSEDDLGKIRLGDTITINCKGCQKAILGKINFISPKAEFTPPLIYSDRTTAELVFRIEAVPDPKQAVMLHPGQPIAVEIFKPVERKNHG